MTEQKPLRIFSYGGGVQSNAVLVLQAQGKLPEPYDVFVFANVGEDSENPATLRYIREVAIPFAEQHGIQIVEVQKTRFGKPETIKEAVFRDNRSVPIPAYMSTGAPGSRTCTRDFKILVVDKWAKKQGASHVVIGLGISVDEFHRAKDEYWHTEEKGRKIGFAKRREYPLLHLRINRAGCKQIITEAGLPISPKSSCFFCPFMRHAEWLELRREQPELFEEAIKIQNRSNEKRALKGKDRVYLHRNLILLENIGVQEPMFTDEEMDNCDEGVCWT